MATIAVFVGSVRRDRKGIKVARWIEKKLLERKHKVYFIDPMDIDLPLLDRMYKEMDNPSQKLVELRNKIKDAEGYIAVTPEYNRSTSSALKNTLDYFLEEYYFKSSAIVSYSPGMFGGVNAAQQLRLILRRALEHHRYPHHLQYQESTKYLMKMELSLMRHILKELENF